MAGTCRLVESQQDGRVILQDAGPIYIELGEPGGVSPQILRSLFSMLFWRDENETQRHRGNRELAIPLCSLCLCVSKPGLERIPGLTPPGSPWS